MIFNNIYSFIENNHLITANSTIIIGLSGGPDSVFLTYLLNALKEHYNITLIAVHLDHEWRTNSADDILFCAQLCKQLAIPFMSKKGSQLKITSKKTGSQEELGRKMRRAFLEEVAQQYDAYAIALGHHMQDQQETFFIRLIRSATLSGLTSMRPKAGKYIRPLLETNKEAILTYLHEHDIPYLTDPTNSSLNYLRNRIRLKVLPALQETDARFDANFLRTLRALQETDDFLYKLTLDTYKKIVIDMDDMPLLDLQSLLALDNFLQKRVLLHWIVENKVSFELTEKLLQEIQRFLVQKKSNQHTLHQQWAIIKKNGLVGIKKLQA